MVKFAARIPEHLLLVRTTEYAQIGSKREECPTGKGKGIYFQHQLASINTSLISSQVAPKIKARMMESGTTMVGYQPDKQRPNFFRMIISNQAITEKDLDFLIDEIGRLGRDL